MIASDILKENNPRHDRMRKTSLRRLFVVLAKIARRVKKFLRNNRCLEPDVAERINHRFAARTLNTRRVGAAPTQADNIVERLARSLQARVSAAEQRPHIGWDQSIRHAVENGLAVNVTQVKRASYMKIDNPTIAQQRPNAGLPRMVFKSQKSHRTPTPVERRASPPGPTVETPDFTLKP